MRSGVRWLRAVATLPLWVVDELRLWAAALAGTRTARRRRRRSEADTELLVPLSPHVGRAGARHAAVNGQIRLKHLQRRAVKGFCVLLVAAVLGGLTGIFLIGARPVGPQVVPTDESTPHTPDQGLRTSPSSPDEGKADQSGDDRTANHGFEHPERRPESSASESRALLGAWTRTRQPGALTRPRLGARS